VNEIAPKKSEFIRSVPATMSVADVVKAGAEKGIALTPMFVYAVRYRDKRKSGTPARAPRRAAPVANPSASSGLVAEIERMAERKFIELVTAKLRKVVG
jgi:hypothetical protein